MADHIQTEAPQLWAPGRDSKEHIYEAERFNTRDYYSPFFLLDWMKTQNQFTLSDVFWSLNEGKHQKLTPGKANKKSRKTKLLNELLSAGLGALSMTWRPAWQGQTKTWPSQSLPGQTKLLKQTA
ncbi:unnamed protein product [Lupinus luteus]|uniref:Uncharacterized protein n=1 Tax=Lupinus luteus TaxID=3873 RepID=A0AAV1WZX5_LUPLU